MASVFLSYRQADDGDYAEALVRELCDAVRRIDAGGTETRVFLSGDDGIVDGDWRQDAAVALAGCRVFVAVCSERYFLTERCGREWWTVQDRLLQHEADTGRRPKALVPLAWGATGLAGPLPADRFASPIGRHEDIRALARLRVNQPRYRELIERLARHVVEVDREDPVPPAVMVLPYSATPNAFRQVRGARPGVGTEQAVGAAAPAVRFVVAAGRREEMARVRRDVEYYGPDRADWRPYQPADPGALARRAQAVAAEHRFSSEVIDDVEHLVEELERADRDDAIVVMLIDAWVVRIQEYRAALAVLDAAHGPSTAVVVPLSDDDPETRRARAALGEALSRLLSLRSARSGRTVRLGPGSAEAFDDQLGDVLETARSLAARSARPRRAGAGDRAHALPLLDAP